MTITATGTLTFAISYLVVGLVVLYFAFDDAQADGWYPAVSFKSVMPLVAWDLIVTWAALTVLLSSSAGAWHGLATAGVVPARTSTGFGTLVLCAVAAVFSAAPVLGTRVSATQRRAVLRGFTRRRGRRLKQLKQTVKIHQSNYHNEVVLPALLRWDRDALAERVHSWCEGQKISSKRKSRIKRYARSQDRQELLTFASEMVRVQGRRYLDDLVKKAPPP